MFAGLKSVRQGRSAALPRWSLSVMLGMLGLVVIGFAAAAGLFTFRAQAPEQP